MRTPLFIAALACAQAAAALASPPDDPAPLSASAPAQAHPADARPAKNVPDPAAARLIEAPPFGLVTVYAPQGAPRGLLLFASGDGGWNLGVRDMAHTAAGQGLWVAGFDTPKFLKTVDANADGCTDSAALLAQLAARVERDLGLPHDLPVLLTGYSSGATLVYAALAQAPQGTFAGGLSLGFCPDLMFHRDFCPGAGHLTSFLQTTPFRSPVFNRADRLGAPWAVLQGDIDQVCAPHYAPDYTQGVAGAKVWPLPHVGHGFGVPRNWMPQYREALESLLPAPHAKMDASPDR
ncbi:MAG TPA: AcvB/VirJ family lysyl-phosphatidylglycerol hydrolase [Mizugakiibacter sp.]